jgi:cytochrome c-type biogenesis protein CcmH
MLQYVLTGLAGVAIGVAVVRMMQSRGKDNANIVQNQTSAYLTSFAFLSGIGQGRKLLIGAGLLLVAGTGILLLRGNEPLTSAPLNLTPSIAENTAQLDDVQTMIDRLAKRLKDNPNDGEGFRMLGWSYVMTGKPELAIDPYKQAARLLPKNSLVLSGYGEALVGVAGGKVTNEAKGLFDNALTLDPTEPRALHFEALWLAQNGQEKEALDRWIALANSGPADAPWQEDVRRRIAETAKKLKIDVSRRLKAVSAGPASFDMPAVDPVAMQAAQAMPEGDRQAMIDGMVGGLAAKLKKNPKDPEGWAKLLRSRMVLEQSDQAARDLTAARKALEGDSTGLAKVNLIARELRVPGA